MRRFHLFGYAAGGEGGKGSRNGAPLKKWSEGWDMIPASGGPEHGWKREKPEGFVAKLRQVDVLQGPGMTIGDAVREIRKQLQRLNELEKENHCPRKAVSDLTLDKMIPAEAAATHLRFSTDDTTVAHRQAHSQFQPTDVDRPLA